VEPVRAIRPPAGAPEAITSRPFLLSAIGRMTFHSGKTHLSITPMHAQATRAGALLTAMSQRPQGWKKSAELRVAALRVHRYSRNRAQTGSPREQTYS
jgi:hypothetical protein